MRDEQDDTEWAQSKSGRNDSSNSPLSCVLPPLSYLVGPSPPGCLLFSFGRMDLFLGLPSSQCETLRGQWRDRSVIKADVELRSLVLVPVASVPWLHGSWTIPGLTSCQSAQAGLSRKHMEPRCLGFILATCELDGSRQVMSPLRQFCPLQNGAESLLFPIHMSTLTTTRLYPFSFLWFHIGFS